MSKLIRVTDRVWYYPCEERRDRPLLGYVRGERFSLAVDAGHSKAHVEDFYEALKAENLPLPEMTVLTHWHWDHTFGMHGVHGISIAGEATNRHLREIQKVMNAKEQKRYMEMEPHIAAEYEDGQEMTVVTADLEFFGDMTIDLGEVHVKLLATVSPHTEDSILVYVPEEKTLFLGDSVCGKYPEWNVDPVKMCGLISTIERLDCEYTLTGHWKAEKKEELLEILRKDAGYGREESYVE